MCINDINVYIHKEREREGLALKNCCLHFNLLHPKKSC